MKQLIVTAFLCVLGLSAWGHDSTAVKCDSVEHITPDYWPNTKIEWYYRCDTTHVEHEDKCTHVPYISCEKCAGDTIVYAPKSSFLPNLDFTTPQYLKLGVPYRLVWHEPEIDSVVCDTVDRYRGPFGKRLPWVIFCDTFIQDDRVFHVEEVE